MASFKQDMKDENDIIHPSLISNQDSDQEEELMIMSRMGLPVAFNELNTLTPNLNCGLCLVTMSSEQAYIAHLNGADHLKRQVNLQLLKEKQPKFEFRGKVKAEEISKTPAPRLKEFYGDYIGLDQIQEILSCSRIEMKPFYRCKRCSVQGDVDQMQIHLANPSHVSAILRLRNLSFEEVEKGQFDLIETIHSDELYPWPEGEAPWSIEQGGSGIPPTSLTTRSLQFDIGNPPRLNSVKEYNAARDALNNLLQETLRFHRENAEDEAAKAKVSTLHAFIMTNLAGLPENQ